MRSNTKRLVRMSILAAFSLIFVMGIHFPIIPAAPWLEYDPADVPLLIGTFMYGPVAGLMMTIVVSAIQAMTVSAASGWVGFIMHVIATGTLVMVAGTVYRIRHTFTGAIVALLLGSAAMALVMIPANLFFTVRYWGVPYEAVVASIPTVILPFNLIKAVGNSIITVVAYKTVAKILRGKADSSIAEE